MHTGKNEFQGTATLIQGLNIQTAYSITNHIGVTSNYLIYTQIINTKRVKNTELKVQERLVLDTITL